MGSQILYRDSQGRDGSVVLDPSQPCYVGRALDCAIRTDDAMVSRKHSMIRMENSRFYVEDLGSSNGTHVNDVRVTKQFLNHNDVVRCGSLWLRFVEDGGVPAEASGGAAASPAKKGSTRRLDVSASTASAGAGAAQQAASPSPAIPMRHGNPPAYPAGDGAQPQASGANAQPAYGGPPAMPAAGSQQPFGGPPAMPAHGEVVAGYEATMAPQQAFGQKEDSVVVDIGIDPAEHSKIQELVDDLNQRIETLQAAYDREAADGKRLRAETQTLRDRIEELRKGVQDKQDAVDAQERVADELRAETRQAKDEIVSARSEMSEMAETLAARERQLSRSHEDIAKLKEDIEELEKQLADVSRTKDEGWKKLNEQLGEIDNLREVVNEQERMLEERRVGLVSQEEVINNLRAEKETTIKKQAQLKAEADELRADTGRLAAQIGAIDEENKRLSQLLAEAQGRAAGGQSVSAGAQSTELAEALKKARVEVRTVESDRDRLQEMYERADSEVEVLQGRVASLEVEVREWHEKSDMASGSKTVAEGAMAKAEVARHKAQEEAILTAQARDEAQLQADQLRRELDRAMRRLDELEGPRAGTDAEHTEAAAANPGHFDALEQARDQLQSQLEASQARVAELTSTIAEMKVAMANARPADASGGFMADATGETTAVVSADSNPGAIKDRALAVHDAINDVLSELRSNILLIQGLFDELAKEDSSDPARTIKDAVEALVGNAEDAKGALRTLKELVEFGA